MYKHRRICIRSYVYYLYTPASELYSIPVVCIVHPNSTADQCVVMALADGRVTRTSSGILESTYSRCCDLAI